MIRLLQAQAYRYGLKTVKIWCNAMHYRRLNLEIRPNFGVKFGNICHD